MRAAKRVGLGAGPGVGEGFAWSRPPVQARPPNPSDSPGPPQPRLGACGGRPRAPLVVLPPGEPSACSIPTPWPPSLPRLSRTRTDCFARSRRRRRRHRTSGRLCKPGRWRPAAAEAAVRPPPRRPRPPGPWSPRWIENSSR